MTLPPTHENTMIEQIGPTIRAVIESWPNTLRLISVLVAATPLAASIVLLILLISA